MWKEIFLHTQVRSERLMFTDPLLFTAVGSTHTENLRRVSE
jgi:hypothetical protein